MPDKRIIFNNHERRPQYMKHQTSGMPVGWCSHNAHRGKLSLKQMKRHNCRTKNCKFFTKNEDHPHWKHKATTKQAKKMTKFAERLEEEIASALTKIGRDRDAEY